MVNISKLRYKFLQRSNAELFLSLHFVGVVQIFVGHVKDYDGNRLKCFVVRNNLKPSRMFRRLMILIRYLFALFIYYHLKAPVIASCLRLFVSLEILMIIYISHTSEYFQYDERNKLSCTCIKYAI